MTRDEQARGLACAQVLALDQGLTVEYLGSTYTLKAQHLLAAGEGGASVSLERGLLTERTQVTFSAAAGARGKEILTCCINVAVPRWVHASLHPIWLATHICRSTAASWRLPASPLCKRSPRKHLITLSTSCALCQHASS